MEGVRSGFYAGFLPFYAPDQLGLAPAAFTLAFTLHHLADNFSKGLGGLLAERVGLGRVLSLAAFMGLAVLLLLPNVQAPWQLWILALLWGVSFSTLYPGLMTLASRIAVPGREARALSFTLVLVMPWIGIGLVGVGQVAQGDPEGALLLLLLAQGGAFFLLLSLFPLRIPLPQRQREAYAWGRLLYFLPAAFGQTFAPALISLFLLRFGMERFGLEPLYLGGLLFLGGGVAVLLLPLTGRLVDRRGYRLALVGGLSLLSLVMLRLGLAVRLEEIVLLALLGGVGYSLFLPGWNGFLAKNLPQENRAAVWGGLMAVEGLGMALGPAAGGILWQLFGLQAPFLAGSGLLFSLALFYGLVFWRMRWS